MGSGDTTATYAYLLNSHLIESITLGTLTTSRSYDVVDRLTAIQTAVAAAGQPGGASTVLDGTSYLLNSFGRRSQAIRANGERWAYTNNDRGEITSSARGQRGWGTKIDKTMAIVILGGCQGN